MATASECIMFTVLTSNGGGNLSRERAFAKPLTRPVLIKRLKIAINMCAFCVA